MPDEPKRTNRSRGFTSGGSTKNTRSTRPEILADELVRQERAYQLKLSGFRTWKEVADAPHPTDPTRNLYAGPSEARRGYLAALHRHAGTAQTEEMRDEWRMRNEKVFRALMPKCLKGDNWAIDRYTRLFAEHARMLGLNAPIRHQIEELTESTVDRAIRQLVEQLAQPEEVGDDDLASDDRRSATGEAAPTS